MAFLKDLFGRKPSGPTQPATAKVTVAPPVAPDPALNDAPYPRLLLVGDHPEMRRLSAVLENIAPRCGFWMKDLASPNWNQQMSFKTIQRNFETLNADEMKLIAREIWGRGCLDQASCVVTVVQLEPMGCFMLTIAKEQQAAASEADNAGYLSNFFPTFGGFRIDAMYIADAAKADQLLSRHQTSRSLVRRGGLDFEVHFNSGREMTDFMEELMAVMKPFAKISNIRYSHHEWQRCEHGRYYSDAWGVGMTACVDCVRTGAKAWLPRK
jgi:hypothetical protein